MRHPAGGAATVLVVVLVLAGAMAAAGWWAWRRFVSPPARLTLSTVKVKAEVMAFAHKLLPPVHAQLVALDDEVALLDAEIKRLDAIARTFPDQAAIAARQKQAVQAARTNLASTLERGLQQVRTWYVTWLVDPSAARQSLAGAAALVKELAAARRQSAGLLARVRAAPAATGS